MAELGPRDPWAVPVLQVHQVPKDNQDLQAHQVLQDLWANRERLERLVCKDQLEYLVLLVTPVSQGRQVSLDQRVHQDSSEQLARKGVRVQWDHQVRRDLLASRVHPVLLDSQELLGSQEQRESLDRLDKLVELEQQVHLELAVVLVFKEHLEDLDLLEQQDQQD